MALSPVDPNYHPWIDQWVIRLFLDSREYIQPYGSDRVANQIPANPLPVHQRTTLEFSMFSDRHEKDAHRSPPGSLYISYWKIRFDLQLFVLIIIFHINLGRILHSQYCYSFLYLPCSANCTSAATCMLTAGHLVCL